MPEVTDKTKKNIVKKHNVKIVNILLVKIFYKDKIETKKILRRKRVDFPNRGVKCQNGMDF